MSQPDPKSGYCPETGTYHTLRGTVPLPPATTPLSAASYALSFSNHLTTSTALINSTTGHVISYAMFRQHVTNLAHSLRTDLNLSKNDVIFIIAANSTTVPIVYFALLSIGVTICPSNPLSTNHEIARQIHLTNPILAFATSSNVDKVKCHVARTCLIDSIDFQSMMTRPPSPGQHVFDSISQGDVAAVMFSSGTTGQVKAVAITHRNLISTVANYYYLCRPEEAAVGLYPVPYFHIFGFHYALRSVALGEAVVVMVGRFELGKMLRAVEEWKVRNLAVVPPILVAMVKSDETAKFDLESLAAVGCGAASLHIDLIKAFTKKFPRVSVYQGFGMTETSGAAFGLTSPDESHPWGSVGKLTGNCEARIVDPDTGVALPPGNQGELWIKGPIVMKGYVDDPKANSETLVAGAWLRSGDICYIDSEGFLFIVDRLKEMIKYKGYQVAPAELEQLLLSHPDIVDAAVIGYPDEEAGQIPFALVVRRHQSNIDAEKITEFIKKQVAAYKRIRRVMFVTSIPKSPSGKILRKELKKITIPDSKL